MLLIVFLSWRISPRTSTVIFLERSPWATAVVTSAMLRCEVVDVVGEVFPGPGGAGHVGLAAEAALGTDLAGHARDFRGETVELVHHDVDGLLQLEDLAANVDGDFLGEIAFGDSGG